MPERSADRTDGEKGDATGFEKMMDRRTILRNTAIASVATTGLTAVPSAAANDYAETLNGSNPESYGDYDNWQHSNSDHCGDEGELAIGSAIDENSATYSDDPAPVMCNWAAKATQGCVRIDNLSMTVSVNNTGNGWNISDAKKSKREAPEQHPYEPAFTVSIGYIANFGLSFSSSGNESRIDYGLHSVSYNFGTACDPCGGHGSVEENTGWLAIHLNNPDTTCENINCEVSVDVSADVYQSGSCPGPCCGSEEGTLSAHNTFQVEFNDDNC